MARKSFVRTDTTDIRDAATGERVSLSTREVMGERIRFFRQRAGIQQADLAERLGIARNSVSSWEIGKSRPDPDNILQLCAILGVSPNEIFGYDEGLSLRERRLIGQYRALSVLDKNSIDVLAGNLTLAKEKRAMKRPSLVRLQAAYHPLVAGIGLSEEWDADGETIYLHDSPLARAADYVFPVRGDSMEPTFHDGCMVAVARVDSGKMKYGDIGAFQFDNSTYIKEYRPEGLYSHNRRYRLMAFNEMSDVRLIGKVLGTVKPEDVATDEEIDLFISLENDLSL